MSSSILDFIYYVTLNSALIEYVSDHSIQIIGIAAILGIVISSLLYKSRDSAHVLMFTLLASLLTFVSIRSNPIYLLPVTLYIVHTCLWFIDENKSDPLDKPLLLFIFMGVWISCVSSVEYYQSAGAYCASSYKYILLTYLGLEVQAIPFYILLGNQWRVGTLNTEGALKTVIMGAVGSGFMLLGLCYMSTRCTTGYQIVNTLDVIGQVLFGAGLAFKLSLIPFHLWIVDAYQVLSYRMISMFATFPKLAAMFLVIHIGFHKPIIAIIIGLFGIISIVFGSMILIVQRTIKSFLAYSSISNIGYIACIAMLYTPLLQSNASLKTPDINTLYQFLSIYIVSYLSSIALITTILNMSGNSLEKLSQLSGFARQNTLPGIILSIALFSLAGLPMTTGFMYKAILFSKFSGTGYTWLAIVIATCSVVSLYGYLRIMKIIYFDSIEVDIPIRTCRNGGLIFLIVISLIATVPTVAVLYYLP